MAHIETWWKCPGCHRYWSTQQKAERCAITHVRPEKWAVSHKHPGKAVSCQYRGTAWALREADLSDLLVEREQELKERQEVHT